MSSKKRSTRSRKPAPTPRVRSLEAIARKPSPRVEPDDDEDIPAIELPGRRARGDAPAAPAPIPADASPDTRQAMLLIEWAAGRGMLLSHVQHGAVTVGIASMGAPRGVKADDLGRASSALYRQFGGAALKRELARAGDADSDDEDED